MVISISDCTSEVSASVNRAFVVLPLFSSLVELFRHCFHDLHIVDAVSVDVDIVLSLPFI